MPSRISTLIHNSCRAIRPCTENQPRTDSRLKRFPPAVCRPLLFPPVPSGTPLTGVPHFGQNALPPGSAAFRAECAAARQCRTAFSAEHCKPPSTLSYASLTAGNPASGTVCPDVRARHISPGRTGWIPWFQGQSPARSGRR